jgi:hypothetical protein
MISVPSALAYGVQSSTSASWPQGAEVVVPKHTLSTAQADTCRRTTCPNVFRPYHESSYAKLGRITGYYEAQSFVPSGGQRTVLYYSRSLFHSNSQANQAATDEDQYWTASDVHCFKKACKVTVDYRHTMPRLLDYAVKGEALVEIMAETPKGNLANGRVAATLVKAILALEPAGAQHPA